jgi:peptide/nickel transport system ATP-binding protein
MLALLQGELKMSEESVLEVKNLTKYYLSGYFITKRVMGCEDVSFNIKRGEIFTLVGESGSGKTTVAKLILRLIKPTSGKIYVNGKDSSLYSPSEYYRKIQAVFQDPFTSFNPSYSVERVFNDVFKFLLKGDNSKGNSPSTKNNEDRIMSALEKVDLISEQVIGRDPHELSGGQMQRLLIARSLLVNPSLLIADEITSMIDASTRVGVLNELTRLRKEEDMSVLFITHDIGQAYYISDRVAVMYKGKIVETGSAEKVFFEPQSDYAKSLVMSIPKLHEKWKA